MQEGQCRRLQMVVPGPRVAAAEMLQRDRLEVLCAKRQIGAGCLQGVGEEGVVR